MNNEDVNELSQRGGQIATELLNYTGRSVMDALNANSSNKNKAEDVFIASMGVAGATHMLAAVVGHSDEGDEAWRRITPVSTLFAAILGHLVSPQVKENGHTIAEFGPHIICQALQMVEILIGENPDRYLDPRMCKMSREYMEDPEVRKKLDEIIEKRRSNKLGLLGLSRTIN
jgi:hypothetical protein